MSHQGKRILVICYESMHIGYLLVKLSLINNVKEFHKVGIYLRITYKAGSKGIMFNP